jgi:hypothetical protein
MSEADTPSALVSYNAAAPCSKAMEERDKAREANGDAPTGTEAGPSKPKETMSFAFAKIWEADSKRIHEMSDDEDEDDRADEDAEGPEAWRRI